MRNFNQNAVSRSIWPWTGTEPVHHRLGRGLRGLIQFLVATPLIVLFFFLGHSLLALVVLVIAGSVLLSSLLFPALFDKIEHFAMILGLGVGRVLTWILLAPFFYVAFTIGRLAMLARGKDPMERTFPEHLNSYWKTHQKLEGVSHYRRQH